MNYIRLINGFWNLHEVKSFRATEISLYFYLLKVCNSVSWSESFELKNQRILVDLCMSYHTMCNARNKLKQSGLIEFETKNGSNKTVYSIVTTFANFDKVSKTSAETFANFDKVAETSAETFANFAKVAETSAETSAETFANFAEVVSISNNNIYNNKTKTKTVVVEEKEKEETAAAAVSFQIKKIIEFWNTRCNNMPAVAGVTPARAREIEDLLRVYTIDEICDCLLIASQSPTLNGERNERPVKIDWCLKNFLSLYEDRITLTSQKQKALEAQEAALQRKEEVERRAIEQQNEQARHTSACVPMPDYILENFLKRKADNKNTINN